jgi:hypothetical protein
MSFLNRHALLGLSALGVALVLPAISLAQQRPAVIEQLAQTYGLGSLGQVEAIRYTFTAELPGVELSRTWAWEPKTEKVTYEGKDKSGQPVKLTYQRSQISGQAVDIEPSFVNDNYWLLLPFHVAWDTDAKVEDAGVQKLPLSEGSSDKLVVKYPSDGGFSPGDTWDLYVGDGRIKEMVFHRGGTAKPGLVIASWTDHRQAGPLLFSLEHRGTADDKPLHVSFSDIAVKLVGSETWIEAR